MAIVELANRVQPGLLILTHRVKVGAAMAQPDPEDVLLEEVRRLYTKRHCARWLISWPESEEVQTPFEGLRNSLRRRPLTHIDRRGDAQHSCGKCTRHKHYH